MLRRYYPWMAVLVLFAGLILGLTAASPQPRQCSAAAAVPDHGQGCRQDHREIPEFNVRPIVAKEEPKSSAEC